MPSTVFEAEIGTYGLWWNGWKPPRMPSLAGAEPWDWDKSAFWKRDISGERPDSERTSELHASWRQDIIISGGKVWQNNTSGLPFNVVPESTPTTKVTDDLYGSGSVRSPLPTTGPTRIECDPAGGLDRHAILYVIGKRLVEHQNLRHQVLRFWFINIDQWVDNGRGSWDLTKPWTASPGGACAAKVPMLPLLVRWEEIVDWLRGGYGITHALPIGLDQCGNYFEGPARATDGKITTGHPCGAGTRLRVKGGTHLKFPEASIDRCICLAGERHGFVVVDTSGAGHAGVGVAADPMFATGAVVDGRTIAPLGGAMGFMGLTTDDLEVIPPVA